MWAQAPIVGSSQFLFAYWWPTRVFAWKLWLLGFQAFVVGACDDYHILNCLRASLLFVYHISLFWWCFKSYTFPRNWSQLVFLDWYWFKMNDRRAKIIPSRLCSVAGFDHREGWRTFAHLHHLRLPEPYLFVQCLRDHASEIDHFNFPLHSSNPPGWIANQYFRFSRCFRVFSKLIENQELLNDLIRKIVGLCYSKIFQAVMARDPSKSYLTHLMSLRTKFLALYLILFLNYWYAYCSNFNTSILSNSTQFVVALVSKEEAYRCIRMCT